MLNLTSQEKKAVLFLIITLSVGSGVLFFKNRGFHPGEPKLVKKESQKNEASIKKGEKKKDTVIIHLAGAVSHPGLYQMQKDSRVGEVIKKTNLLSEADISNINLARTVRDGEKIFIPARAGRKENNLNSSSKSSIENINLSIQNRFLNINQADVLALSELPGIGRVLAQRIVDWRRQAGSFKTKEELKEVKGIGEGRFNKIKDLIVLN